METERGRLGAARAERRLSRDELRTLFLRDLAVTAAFQSDFPLFLESAAAEHSVNVEWANEQVCAAGLPGVESNATGG